MRMTAAIVAALLAAPQQAPKKADPAEQAYLDMCAALDRTRSFSQKFEASLLTAEGLPAGEVKGVFRTKGSSRAAYEVAGETLLGSVDLKISSSGTVLKVVGRLGQAMPDVQLPVMPGLGWVFAADQARIGSAMLVVAFLLNAADPLGALNPDRFTRAEGFKLGTRTTVGSQPATVLEYVVGPESGEGPKYRVKVWLDPRTSAPVKRHVRVPFLGKDVVVEETYTDVVFGLPLDEKLFEE